MTWHIDPVEAYLSSLYEFRRNPVLDRVEYKSKGAEKFQLLKERDINSLLRQLKMDRYKCTITSLKTILNSDFIPDTDPFLAYFDGLPEWTNGVDHIAKLANTITTTTQEYWQEYFKKWLVASVACAVDEDQVNHQVLVLVGCQGIGKSSWLNSLLPQQLKGYLYTGLIDPNNKDTLIHLAENFFINLDELENLNKTELGSLKSLITQSSIKLRKAYAVFNENLHRRASFMGSVNDAEFLNDTTGNRRYLCFTCEAIDYRHDVNMDLVYAQAYSLYRSGSFKYYFGLTDIPDIEKINAQYLRVSVEEDLLLKYFIPTDRKDEDRLEITPVEILNEISKLEGANVFDKYTSPRRLGQALQKHGFNKISKNSRKPYLVKHRMNIVMQASSLAPDIMDTSGQQGIYGFDPEEEVPIYAHDTDPLPEYFKKIISEQYNGSIEKGIAQMIKDLCNSGEEPIILNYLFHAENGKPVPSSYNISLLGRIKQRWNIVQNN